MRLIHTSDWHLGRRLHGQDLLDDQAAFLEWLLAVAVLRHVDAVLVSGDIYDRAQPGADAVRLLDRTVAAFAEAGILLVMSSGNHDSAVRLQYGGDVLARAGIHVRTEVDQVAQPIIIDDEAGAVAVYGIPFVVPDAVTEGLGVARSHGAVLEVLADRIRRDAQARALDRVVVMAHAFVTGGTASDSEREIRIGGVGDVPADVFAGFTYVALGHLHGPQSVATPRFPNTTIAYSGSPLAFSFSERDHTKSVSLVEIDGVGCPTVERLPAPVPRPLHQVSGRLEDLCRRAQGDLAHLADAWVKVVLTDPGRVASPMERLRAHWPHTLVLEFAPERDGSESIGLARLNEATDPVDICCQFVRAVSGDDPTSLQREILVDAVHAARRVELSA